MRPPNLPILTLIFLRIGNTTVGGGEPTVAALQSELTRRGWLSAEQFGFAYALARITPGTNMLAFCAAAGWYVLGIAGSIAAVLAATIPSSIIVLWLTRVCEAGDRVPWLGAAVSGAIAAGVGIMVAAAGKLARSQTRYTGSVVALLFVGGAFLLRLVGLSPLQTLTIAAAMGLLWSRS
jgi:chromate transporter